MIDKGVDTMPSGERNAGLDLLRLVSMYLIVVQHCCIHHSWSDASICKLLFLFTVPAVDCFAGMSGWFGVRFSFRKLIRLLLQIGSCSVSLSLIAIALFYAGAESRLLVSPGVGWFSECYIAMFLVAPIMNWALSFSGRSKVGRVTAISAWAIWLFAWQYVPARYFLVLPISGSHSLGTLLLVYCTLRLFGEIGIARVKVRLSWMVALSLACVAAIFAQGVFGIAAGRDILLLVNGFYASPFVILFAALIVAIFSRLKTCGRFTALITGVAPSLFSVYLLHSAHVFGDELLILRPLRYLREVLPGCMAIQLIVPLLWSVVVMAVCIFADRLFRLAFAKGKSAVCGLRPKSGC